jgi:hypothetical protein
MLTSVHVEFSGELRMDMEQVTPLPADPERVSIPVPSQTVQFCFWNGVPVVDTLHSLSTEVKLVLAEFQRDFGESDKLIPRQ